MTKADVEKARTNSHARRQHAEDAKNEYSNRLVKFNERQKSHNYEDVPTILNSYQNVYLKNVDEFRMTIQRFCAAQDKYRPMIEKCVTDMRIKASDRTLICLNKCKFEKNNWIFLNN